MEHWFCVGRQILPAPYNVSPPPATFGRPLAEAISDALTQSKAATDKTLLSKQFGSAYIIDPIGTSILAYPGVPGQANRNGPAVTFPAAAYYASTFTSPSSLYFTSGLWTSWSATPTKSDLGQLWPVRRATFRGVSTGWQLDPTMAEHYFRASDDLATDLPARDDRPVAQEWDTDKSTGAPLARQWTGDYSWIASVVPTTNAARDGIAANPESFDYDVSVVVFHKRPLPVSAASMTISNLSDYYNAMSENERAVKASILSTSLKGGELRLTDIGDNPAKSPFEGLKTGQWIMLCGPHPNSSDSEPRFFLKWYKVKSIDSEGTGISSFDPSKERIVSVSGPQWPWLPRTSYPASQQNLDSAKISDSLCVAICKGAVAVHTKTLRLEGHSAWSAAGPQVEIPVGLAGAVAETVDSVVAVVPGVIHPVVFCTSPLKSMSARSLFRNSNRPTTLAREAFMTTHFDRLQTATRRKARPPRNGVLLLVVLSMLVLFMLIGTAFLMSSSHEQKTAQNLSKVGRLGNNGTKLLDRALLHVLRDTENPHSAIRYHSLLRDLYGTDGFQGVTSFYTTGDPVDPLSVGQTSRFSEATAANPLGPTNGQFVDIYFKQLFFGVTTAGKCEEDPQTTFNESTLTVPSLRNVLKLDRDALGQTQIYPLPITTGYFNGCLLTITSGPASGQTTRILGYDRIADLVNKSGAVIGRIFRFRVMSFQRANGASLQIGTSDSGTPPPRTPELVDLTNASFIVNGRAFSGTGVGYNPLAVAGQPRLSAVETFSIGGNTFGIEIGLLPNSGPMQLNNV